jgi:hypothetical protein
MGLHSPVGLDTNLACASSALVWVLRGREGAGGYATSGGFPFLLPQSLVGKGQNYGVRD